MGPIYLVTTLKTLDDDTLGTTTQEEDDLAKDVTLADFPITVDFACSLSSRVDFESYLTWTTDDTKLF